MSQGSLGVLLLVFLAGCTPMLSGGDAGDPDAGESSDAGAGDAGHPDAGVDAGSDPQERYTYSSCPDDGGSAGYCPRMLVFYCAVSTIREKYVSCQSPSDCVAVSPPNCVDAMICPPAAVNDAGAFLAEVGVEIERYCDRGRCRGFGSCGRGYQRRFADCVGGRCVALQDDGGL